MNHDVFNEVLLDFTENLVDGGQRAALSDKQFHEVKSRNF